MVLGDLMQVKKEVKQIISNNREAIKMMRSNKLNVEGILKEIVESKERFPGCDSHTAVIKPKNCIGIPCGEIKVSLTGSKLECKMFVSLSPP
jgi:hypothetical protein